MGRRSKPTAIKIFDGEKDRRKRETGEVKPDELPDGFQPPRGMSTAAKTKWHEMVNLLKQVPGLLTICDVDLLQQYCEIWCEQRRAKRAADKSGWVNAKNQQSGDAQRYWKTTDILIRLMCQIGLTPSARVGLKPSENALKPTEKNKKASYLG